MKLIKLGTLRKGLIYPLFLYIYLFIRTIHTKIINEVFYKNKLLKTDIFFAFLMSIGEFVGSFFKKFYKFKKNKNIDNNKQIKLLNKFSYKFIIKKYTTKMGLIPLILLICLTTFFDLISYLVWIFILTYNKFEPFLVMDLKYKIFQLFLATICCKLLLNKPIYQHHIFSIKVSFIFAFIIFISDFIILYNCDDLNIKNYFLTLIFLIIANLLFAIHETLEKYLMDEIYINTFDLLRCEGLIEIIFAIPFFYLYLCVSCIVKEKEEFNNKTYNYCDYSFTNVVEYFKLIFDFKGFKILFIFLNFIIFIFECSLVNIYRLLNTKFFSPMYRAISDSLMMPIIMIIYFIFFTNKNENLFYLCFFIDFFMYIPIIFSSLVFNEIFILEFWNLSYNTYEKISERAKIQEINLDEKKSNLSKLLTPN